MWGKVACIDLDGTLAHYNEWQGELHFGNKIQGASFALSKLKENNWGIIIYTTRTNKELISKFLKENNIPFDYINENPFQPDNAIGGKPFADVYIDDKAIQFNGNWELTIQEVLNFETWEKRKKVENDSIKYSKDFLINDFNQSYQQLRHYDSLNWEITKFSFTELLLGIAAVWAIYGFANSPDNKDSFIAQNFIPIISAILGVCYIFSLLASFLISRNRVYFSKAARYLNEHRKFSFDIKPFGFENKTRFYTNINFPSAFDIWSTHLVSLYTIQFISSIVLGILIYCVITNLIEIYFIRYSISILVGVISFVVNLYVYISYMKKQDKEF